ncbi:hypothetical protein [Sporisorium scitamineum]|uniref:Uncharacterized protein n=1 Tax=Sporisorium scitamineum TaxID=49012 RepID=A0A0F7S2P4_9BASI|nr:hypothetical protein [Sporisorium scitamineum]
MSTILIGSPEASPSRAFRLEPYQSAAFQQIRSRMQALSTPPDLAPSPANKQLALSAAAASYPQSRRQSTCSPSPPATESGNYADQPSASNTPLTLATDSSASSSSTSIRTDAFRRQATACSTFALHAHPPARTRPGLANKRVLSEGQVILPRPAKRSRMPSSPTLRKQSCDALHSASSFLPSVTAITSWRMACEQRRQRHLAKSKSRLHAASLKRAAAASTLRKPSRSAATTDAEPTLIKSDPLPELRLLSATRTAPIGWSHFAGANKAFVPHMVEVYDERAAKRAPERQRFWPIIDHQLDYTGARMLLLSNSSYRSLAPSHPATHSGAKSLFDPPVSPKSGLPVYSQPMGSSDEDSLPLTPDAPIQSRSLPRRASQYARDAVANESRRKSTISLSPAATLPPQVTATVKSSKPDLAAHAPLRIAPRRSVAATGPSSDSRRTKDYFGHWETYLCNFGKESTF